MYHKRMGARMIIRHKRALDVAFDVVSKYEGSTHYKLKGYWWNMGFTMSWPIFPRPAYIEVAKSDWHNWERVFDVPENLYLHRSQS